MSIWHGQGLRSESEDHVLDYNESRLGNTGFVCEQYAVASKCL